MADMTAESTQTAGWGVTVGMVLAKLPHIDVDRAQAAGDDVFRGDATGVSREDIAQFIGEVEGRLQARIAGWDTVTGGTLRTVVNLAAPSLITCGAAAMTVDAEFPASVRPSDLSGLSSRLWKQYREDMDVLVEMVEAARNRDTGAGGGASGEDELRAKAGHPTGTYSYSPASMYVRW